jgi:hypothetical protein
LRGFGDKESLNETLNQMKKKILKKVMLDMRLYDMKLLQKIM